MTTESSPQNHAALTQSDKKHRDIVAAAEKVFIENGYQQSSMNEIAQVANVSKRTLYKKFASKEALFDYILRDLIDSMYSQIDTVYLPDAPLKDQFKKILVTLWDTVSDEKTIKLKRVVIAEYVSIPHFISPVLDEVAHRDQGLKAWLQGAIDSGHLVNCDKNLVFEFIVGLIERVAETPLIFDCPIAEGDKKQRIIDEIVDLLVLKYGA